TGYSIVGAWFTIENYSYDDLKRMRGAHTAMPGGYTELWPDTSDFLASGNYVAVAQWYGSAETVKNYINASYTALTNPGKNPIAAGNPIWAGFQGGWPGHAFTWDMTVRLIGYGTPPGSAITGA